MPPAIEYPARLVPGNEPFVIERLGVVMEPDLTDPNEMWGVLNPACARTRAGDLLLFPRVVAEGNRSRIAIARVDFSSSGDPCGVERLGYALEPREPYEMNSVTAGCEDPRVTFVSELDVYLMTYTAFGPLGARIAVARSDDLLTWTRLGLVKFAPAAGIEFDFFSNKDGLLFPDLIPDPHGRPALGLIHRPDYGLSWDGRVSHVVPRGVTDDRPAMWLSYCPIDSLVDPLKELPPFRDHHRLLGPSAPWEALKVGGGAPPLRTQHGWLTVYHGVSGEIREGIGPQPHVHYAAGAAVLDLADPRRVLYRSRQPVLSPELREEHEGMVPNVVFPTALDPRDGGRVDVYYGMADSRIGAGRLSLPEVLPDEEETIDSEAVA